MRSKKRKYILIFATVFIAMFLFVGYENKHLVISYYTYKSEKIAKDLYGFKIIQISDLHNASFGKDNHRLLDLIEKQNPDMIVLTGDLVDSNHSNIDLALRFVEDTATICPVYYITGNHEKWLREDDLNKLLKGLNERGIMILDNKSEVISKGNASFCLVGLDDRSLTDDTLSHLLKEHENDCTIVLAHEPQYIQNYASAKADLVLSGHAHGGQFRFPLIGGVVAPGQGFNPKYTEGAYNRGATTMIVSRGLGNSIIPVRLFNRPEVTCVVLKSEDSQPLNTKFKVVSSKL